METVRRVAAGGGGFTVVALKLKQTKSRPRFFGVLVFASLLMSAAPCSGVDLQLPPVNLGDTNFQDAIAFPGWLAEELFTYYRADQFNDDQGKERPGSNQVTIMSAVTHLAWISNFKVLGGFYGAEVLLPLAQLDLKTEFGPKDRDQGPGDVSVSPFFIQWPERALFGMPFFQRLDLLFKLPTGDYSRHSAVNVGTNVYSFNPYYTFTLVPLSRLEFSSRWYYLWNSENGEPFFRLRANDAQPGQAVHANVAASYEIFKDLRLGVAGYALSQITDDKLDGDDLARSKERVFGIGPGLKYKNDGWLFYVNSYYEFGAENRPEGVKFAFRISRIF
jgi:hypothetical protein